jgi:hypothetical protein
MRHHRSEHGTILYVSVLLLIVAVAIVIGVSVVAIGRGGEMAEFPADSRPLDADISTAADVALLRPPPALWGYDKRATDAALNAVAQTVTERDVEIATLRQQLDDLRAREAGTAGTPGQPAVPGEARAGHAGAAGQSGALPVDRWSAWKRPVPPQPGETDGTERQGENAQ